MTNTTHTLRYDRMVEQALRGVVRDALSEVAEQGLPGNHHFYITFRTRDKHVEMPDYLREQYPQDMTIVLQYQFFGLTVDADSFTVMLSFNNIKERLVIPFSAIVTFADPSVNFALQFQHTGDSATLSPSKGGAGAAKLKAGRQKESAPSTGDEPEKKGEVVSLAQFRKKDTGKDTPPKE
jgi:uncharacterized protein